MGSGWVKIGDFGISKRAVDSRAPTTIKGTYSYIAPELLHNADSSSRAKVVVDAFPPDLWALGEIAFRMLTGTPTFESMVSMMTWLQNPNMDFLRRLEPRSTQDAADLVQGLLNIDPARRLTARETVKHRWIVSHAQSELRADSWPIDSEQDGPQLPQSDEMHGFGEASAQWSTLTVSTKAPRKDGDKGTIRPERTVQTDAPTSKKDQVSHTQGSTKYPETGALRIPIRSKPPPPPVHSNNRPPYMRTATPSPPRLPFNYRPPSVTSLSSESDGYNSPPTDEGTTLEPKPTIADWERKMPELNQRMLERGGDPEQNRRYFERNQKILERDDISDQNRKTFERNMEVWKPNQNISGRNRKWLDPLANSGRVSEAGKRSDNFSSPDLFAAWQKLNNSGNSTEGLGEKSVDSPATSSKTTGTTAAAAAHDAAREPIQAAKLPNRARPESSKTKEVNRESRRVRWGKAIIIDDEAAREEAHTRFMAEIERAQVPYQGDQTGQALWAAFMRGEDVDNESNDMTSTAGPGVYEFIPRRIGPIPDAGIKEMGRWIFYRSIAVYMTGHWKPVSAVAGQLWLCIINLHGKGRLYKRYKKILKLRDIPSHYTKEQIRNRPWVGANYMDPPSEAWEAFGNMSEWSSFVATNSQWGRGEYETPALFYEKFAAMLEGTQLFITSAKLWIEEFCHRFDHLWLDHGFLDMDKSREKALHDRAIYDDTLPRELYLELAKAASHINHTRAHLRRLDQSHRIYCYSCRRAHSRDSHDIGTRVQRFW